MVVKKSFAEIVEVRRTSSILRSFWRILWFRVILDKVVNAIFIAVGKLDKMLIYIVFLVQNRV